MELIDALVKLGVMLKFPWPAKELSPNARVHWSKKHKASKRLRTESYIITNASNMKIDWEGDIHLWIDFYPPDKRHRDQDNMISACKSMLDGMADALGVNDKRFRLHPFVKDQTGGFVTIKITGGHDKISSVK